MTDQLPGEQLRRTDNGLILTNAADAGQIDGDWFDPEAWRAQGLLRREAAGRAAAWFVGRPGRPLVLRHYHRGGLPGRLLSDQYLFTGANSSRPLREFRLLRELFDAGLPVPEPVGARVQRSGLIYRGDLLTAELVDTAPLADVLMREPLSPAHWRTIGAAIGELHARGIWHADLNARNILLRSHEHAACEVFLIDFDRARERSPGRWQQANLARLERSLNKFAVREREFYFAREGWRALLRAYQEVMSAGV